MAARKFKSPEELGIRADEHKWLAKAAKFLAAMKPRKPKKVPKDGNFVFDMGTISETDASHKCGTVGCIWGAAHQLARAAGEAPWGDYKSPDCELRSPALYWLFFPDRVNFDKVTPLVAARATERFLRTGNIKFGVR